MKWIRCESKKDWKEEAREALAADGLAADEIENIIAASEERPFGDDARDYEDEYPHGMGGP